MARRLTKKEKGFVRDIVAGKNGVEAALDNYETKDYSTAGNIASENLKKPKIIEAIEEALPDELLNRVHLEGLEAIRTTVTDSIEPDYATRAKYLDMAYKRRGLYAAEKSVNINIDATPNEKIKKLAEHLNK